MWIVLSTYATSDCAIHVWDEAGKNIDVGFDVSVDVIGELGPAGGWKLDRAGGGWERYTSSKVLSYYLEHGYSMKLTGVG